MWLVVFITELVALRVSNRVIFLRKKEENEGVIE